MNRLWPGTVDRWVVVAAIVYTSVLLVFGYVAHAEPADVTPESDGYIRSAGEFLAGTIPRDVFHPMLYAALVAVVSWLPGVEVFEAGRLVTSVATGVAAWCIYRIGLVVFGSRSVGGAAALTFALHPFVITHGVMAASDLTFVAWCMATLLALAHCVAPDSGSSPGRRRRRLMACGMFCGLAWSTRYPGAILVVPVATGLLLGFGPRAGACQLAWVVGGAALAAVPQGLVNFVTFGDPFYSEAWRNLAFKLAGGTDFGALFSPEIEGLGWSGVIASDPERVLDGAFHEFRVGLTDALPRAVALGWPGMVLSVAAGLAVLVTASGMFGADGSTARARRVMSVSLGVFVLAFLAAVSATFFARVRLMLPLAPAVVLLGGYGLLLVLPRIVRPMRYSGRVHAALFGAILIGAGSMPWVGSPVFARFANNRSPGVYAAARWIEANAAPDVVVLGDHPILAQFVSFRYIHDSHGARRSIGDAQYLRLLEHVATQGGTDYLLFCSKFVAPRPRCLVEGPTPPFLREVFRADGAVLYAVGPP